MAMTILVWCILFSFLGAEAETSYQCNFYDTSMIEYEDGEEVENMCHHEKLPKESVLQALDNDHANLCCADSRSYVFYDNCGVS